MKNSIRKIFKYIFIVFLGILFLFIFYILYLYLSTPDVRYLIKGKPEISALMQQRIKEAKTNHKNYKIRYRWVRLKKIPSLLIKSIILTEDANFYRHKGIDYYELKESIKKNLKSGKKVRGGSTITQQLAKNLFLSNKKTYTRKIREFFIAKQLEKHLTKRRILEIYLNIIEFGKGIFGVEAASRYYFKRTVSKLRLSEILRLVAVIPKPTKITPLSNSRYLRWRVNLILKRLKENRVINKSIYKKNLLVSPVN